jgi:hypothetical protein
MTKGYRPRPHATHVPQQKRRSLDYLVGELNP